MPPRPPSAVGERRRSRRIARRPQSAPLGPRRIAWTLAGLILTGLTILVVSRMYARPLRTAIVQISIDKYRDHLIAPLPFGREDAKAIEGLARKDRVVVTTHEGKDTQKDLKEIAGGTVTFKEIDDRKDGHRDVAVAIIRAQTAVMKDGTEWRASILPEVFGIGAKDGEPSGAYPIGPIVKRFANSHALTTLVALDLGDLAWDPRLGIVGSLVPLQLDEDLKNDPGPDGAGEEAKRPPRAGEKSAWVLTSHDAFESSGVSLAAKRSFFSRALELALRGMADEKNFGGDADGWVELDELARFVAAQTNKWSDDHDKAGQHPVLWCYAAPGRNPGRVSMDEVPKGIRIASCRAPERLIWWKRLTGRASPPPPTATAMTAPAQASPPVAKDQPPEEPPPPPTLWDHFDAAAGRPSPKSVQLPAGKPHPLTYAPHLWRQLEHERAFADARALVSGSVPPQSPGGDEEIRDPQKTIDDKLRVAGTQVESFIREWGKTDQRTQKALEARNQAIELAWAVTTWSPDFEDLKVQELCKRIRDLQEKLEATDTTNGLDQATQKVTETSNFLREKINEKIDKALKTLDKVPKKIPSAEFRRLAASRLLTADQRSRLHKGITEAVTSGKREAAEGSAKAPPSPDRTPSADVAKDLTRSAGDPSSAAAAADPSLAPDEAATVKKASDHPWHEISKRLTTIDVLLACCVPRAKPAEARTIAIEGLKCSLEEAQRTKDAMKPSEESDRLARDLLLRRRDPRDSFELDGKSELGWLPPRTNRLLAQSTAGATPPGVSTLKLAVSSELFGTVEGGETVKTEGGGKERRETRRVSAVEPAAGKGSWKPGFLTLRPLAGGTTAWRMEMANETDRDRQVTVELVSLRGSPDAVSEESWEGVLEVGSAAGSRIGEPVPVSIRKGNTAPLPAFSLPDASGGDRQPGSTGPTTQRGPADGIQWLAIVVREFEAISGTGVGAPADGRPASSPGAATGPEKGRWVFPLKIDVRHPWNDLVQAEAIVREDGVVEIKVSARKEALPDGGIPVEARVLGTPAGRESMLRFEQPSARLDRVRPSATIRGKWNGAGGALVQVGLDIGGYPRGLILEIKTDGAIRGKKIPTSRPARIAIVTPEENQAFQSRRIPVSLEVDFPSLPGLEVALAVTNRGTAGGKPTELKRLTTDRRITHRLSKPADGRTLAVTTEIEDWTIADFDTELENTDGTLEASIVTSQEGAAGNRGRDERRVVIDGVPPTLRAPTKDKTRAGESYTWRLTASDRADGPSGSSGIATVEYGRADDGDDLPAKWRKWPGDVSFGPDGDVPIELGDLLPREPGRYRFVARARDRAENESAPVTLDLEVEPPPPPPVPTTMKDDPTTPAPTSDRPNSLQVKVLLDGKPIKKTAVEVTIVGPDGKPQNRTTNDTDGSLTISKLPPGIYKVTVKSEIISGPRFCKTEEPTKQVEVRPAPADKATVEFHYRR
jgi:hypothetical protein